MSRHEIERNFFLPGNFCNNNSQIRRNKNLFERNFVLPTNVKDGKLYMKKQYIGPREEPSGPCLNSNHQNQITELKNKLEENNCQQNNCKPCCSNFAGVINEESDLFRLYYYNTRCPSRKFQVTGLANKGIPYTNNYNNNTSNNIVGIKNPEEELCPETQWTVEPCFANNVRNICNDPSGLDKCEYNNYLRGTNAAAAQTDVRYNMTNCRPSTQDIPIQNNWRDFTQISNLSSDIPYDPIRNRLVDYTNICSNPFMLEDVRVRKKPIDRLQPCNNLFNNMTRRRNLFQAT